MNDSTDQASPSVAADTTKRDVGHAAFAFTFASCTAPLVCRAFSMPFRAVAIAIVALCTYGVWSVWSQVPLGNHANPAALTGLYWSLAALALMTYSLWCILTSTTTLTSHSLAQTFVWNKYVALQDLAYCKLIRVPGLDWLIAPRLYCRTVMGKFAVFYAADPAMIAQMQRLRDELDAYRRRA
jgi:hypothetical protein